MKVFEHRFYGIYETFDKCRIVAEPTPPGWPAEGSGCGVCFEVDCDQVVVSDLRAEKSRLSTDMLYIEVPIISGSDLFADSLLDCVAVRKCKEHERGGLGTIERTNWRRVDVDSHVRVVREGYHLLPKIWADGETGKRFCGVVPFGEKYVGAWEKQETNK